MLKRQCDCETQKALISEAGRLKNAKRGEPIENRIQYQFGIASIANVLVNALGYMTAEQFKQAVDMAADLQLDEEETQ